MIKFDQVQLHYTFKEGAVQKLTVKYQENTALRAQRTNEKPSDLDVVLVIDQLYVDTYQNVPWIEAIEKYKKLHRKADDARIKYAREIGALSYS
jgi:hypothetical protein